MEAQCSCIILHLLHQTTKLSSSLNKETTLQYTQEFIPLSTINTTASMQLSLHSLCYELGHQGTIEEIYRLCLFCPKKVQQSAYSRNHYIKPYSN